MAHFFKELLQADELIRVFGIARVPHPVVIDMFGLAGGYHGFWLDQEHGGLTYDQIAMACVSARANGMDTFVRMAPTDYARVTQAYEAGAGGVMAARIDSAEQAEEFVRWAKFHPRGNRGFNVGGFDAGHTHLAPAEFAEQANRKGFVAIQIETLGALSQVEEIAAIPDVDLLFLGPSDLSQALGHVGELNHPKVWEAIERVSAACEASGKAWGTVPASPAFAEKCVEKGCRMLLMGHDVKCLKEGIETVKRGFQAFFPR